MIVDGKEIARDVYTKLRARVASLVYPPTLTIITCAPNFETKKYLALKEKKAADVGVRTKVIEQERTSTTQDFVDTIKLASQEADGIIVQLPLPAHIDVETVLNTIPTTHDVDALRGEISQCVSPVVGSIQEILRKHDIIAYQKFVTIIGSGRLVGLPAYHWFISQGAHVSVVTRDTDDIAHYTLNADIVVCGAGAPGFLKPAMIREGVVLLDAGTSEDGGVLKGDADPDCASHTSFFTSVPGGIGPITIAILLQNVVDCAERKKPVV